MQTNTNYLITFRDFIAQFVELSTKIADTDRQKVQTLKKQYLEETQGAAEGLRSRGFYDIAFAVGSIGVFTLRMFTKSDIDTGMIDLTTREILPGMKSLFMSRIDAVAKQTDAKQFVLSTELQAKAQGQSDTGKQEALNALSAAFAAAKP